MDDSACPQTMSKRESTPDASEYACIHLSCPPT